MTGQLQHVGTLMGNTVRELVRSKVLYNLVVFAVLFIASSMFVAQLTIGEWDRVILDMGLAAIHLSGVLIAILIGVGLVAGEIERKTILPTLARPLSRGTFLFGRFVGLGLILAANVLVMIGVLGVVLHLAGYGLPLVAVQAAQLIFIELLVLAAAAIFFATFTTPILASAFSLSLFLIGHLLSDLKAFGARGSTSAVTRGLMNALYFVLPDLELLNVKSQVTSGIALPPGSVMSASVYGLAYAAVLLLLGVIVFESRDLK
ncbi:MAG: ABC transporter permease [Deltaproteobacteria bacterium]|nr:ABC transporter permease [Deltaproteobacteria bacterium]